MTKDETRRIAANIAKQQVAENIGGVARMTEWVRKSPENEKAFWTSIYTKLLPLQVAGDKDNPLSIHRIERTIVEHHASPALAPPVIDNEVTIERETSSAELPKRTETLVRLI
jgi:hypothetical protein